MTQEGNCHLLCHLGRWGQDGERHQRGPVSGLWSSEKETEGWEIKRVWAWTCSIGTIWLEDNAEFLHKKYKSEMGKTHLVTWAKPHQHRANGTRLLGMALSLNYEVMGCLLPNWADRRPFLEVPAWENQFFHLAEILLCLFPVNNDFFPEQWGFQRCCSVLVVCKGKLR